MIGTSIAITNMRNHNQLLLDQYPGAAAAYSLRKLRNNYSGSAIRVRRSSDNAETDIGFNGAGNLDETALTTFTGANDGFVTTWYDQSGNGNNAAQTTASAQPKIVASGTILEINNRPTILLDGLDDQLAASDADNLSMISSGTDIAFAISSVHKILSATTPHALIAKDTGIPNREYAVGYFVAGDARFFIKNAGGNDQISKDNQEATQTGTQINLIAMYDGSANVDGITMLQNGTLATTGNHINGTYTAMSNTSAPLTIGAYTGSTAFINANLHEIVIWRGNKSEEASNIATTINQYYEIY